MIHHIIKSSKDHQPTLSKKPLFSASSSNALHFSKRSSRSSIRKLSYCIKLLHYAV